MLESLQLSSSFPHPTKPAKRSKTHPTKKPNSVSMALLSQCLPGQPRPLLFTPANRRTPVVHAPTRTTGAKRSILSTCLASGSSSPSGSGHPWSLLFTPANRRTPLVHVTTRTTGAKRGSFSTCLASGSSGSSSPSGSMGANLVELPIFPLPLVLFPGAMLPLQIFEFRYRIMMHTLLQTDLRFGVLFSNPMPSSTDPSSGLVEVGCVAEVVKHQRLVDDRFFLICKGQERFRISHVLRTKPYMVAAVSWLEDRPPPGPAQGDDDLENLAAEVEGYMKDVIRISNRLEGKKTDNQKPEVDLRKGQFPTPFSFFVASTFEGAPREQQVLLELEDTAARLKRERDTLKSTLNYLTAASAVKDAFPSSP